VVVKEKPGFAEVEPFKTVLSGDREAIAKLSIHDLFKILNATLAHRHECVGNAVEDCDRSHDCGYHDRHVVTNVIFVVAACILLVAATGRTDLARPALVAVADRDFGSHGVLRGAADGHFSMECQVGFSPG
jgi:hypothetical protein